MKLTLEVEDKTIADVLDGAGSRYWCSNLDWNTPSNTLPGHDSCWMMLLSGQIDFVTVEEDRSEEGERKKHHRVTRAKIEKAIQIIYQKFPHHIENVLRGYNSPHTDMWTGDVLLQCAALGDIKYG